MNLSHKGFTQLRSRGFRAKPYRDSNGNLVVGYGHKVVPGDGVAYKDVINTFKASELLLKDVEQAVAVVVKDVPNNIAQEKFDALVLSKLK